MKDDKNTIFNILIVEISSKLNILIIFKYILLNFSVFWFYNKYYRLLVDTVHS